MILGQLGLDIGPAVAGLGVVGIAVGFGAQCLVRDYLNGALILIENQFAKGDVVRVAGVAGTVEDFTPAADDAARPRRRRPHRAQRRDQGRLEPDPRLGAHQPGRDGRLRDRHRQGDRGRRRGRPGDGRRPGLEAARPRGAARRAGRRRWPSTASRSRSWARSAPPTSGPPPATCASGCSPRSRRTASRSRGRSGSSWPAMTTPTCAAGARRSGPGRRRRLSLDRRRERRGRMTGPDRHSPSRSPRERRAAASVARDREPPRRVADLPAGPGLHRPGQRDGRPLRRGRGRLRGVLGEARARADRLVDAVRRRRSSGTCRSPSGSPAAQLNVAYNCVDRHVERGLGDKVAYHWIGEPGDTRTLTYRDLQREVSARPPTRSRSSASRRATGSPSTCR